MLVKLTAPSSPDWNLGSPGSTYPLVLLHPPAGR